MDKILVTGVAGFIGSNLAKHLLLNEKNFVYGIDNFSHATMSNLYPLLKNERFEFIEHDLLSDISFQVDIIFHFAGCGDLSRYYNNKYDFILNKIEIAKRIISYSQAFGAKLIFPSIYQDKQTKNSDLFKYYDYINLIEALLLDQIENNKLNCKIVRLEEVYGENMLKDDKRYIPTVIKQALLNLIFNFDSDEKCHFTYIKDVIINLEKISRTYVDIPIIDLINKNLYLKSDVARLIVNYLKSNSKVCVNNEITKTPSFSPVTTYGFECNTPIIDGIINTIKHYKLINLS